MTTAISPLTASRLEKAATDNGFDQELARDGQWLAFGSTQCPLRIWLRIFSDAVFLVAFSQQNVVRALGEYGTPLAAPLPAGAAGGHTVTEIPALHRLLGRAFQLSKTLPDELLHTVGKATAALPKTTEIERLVVQRVGQDIFRRGLVDFWEGRCAVTGWPSRNSSGIATSSQWADCESDAERLDAYNGILLAIHLDAVFDKGLMTVEDDGAIVWAHIFGEDARQALGVCGLHRVRGLAEGHRAYLPWHREKVFRGRRTMRT